MVVFSVGWAQWVFLVCELLAARLIRGKTTPDSHPKERLLGANLKEPRVCAAEEFAYTPIDMEYPLHLDEAVTQEHLCGPVPASAQEVRLPSREGKLCATAATPHLERQGCLPERMGAEFRYRRTALPHGVRSS